MFSLPRPIRTLAVGLAAGFGVFAGPALAQDISSPPGRSAATTSSPDWEANDDDFLFLQLVIKNYKLNYDVRGYRTNDGVCLDFADVIQSLDLPIRLDKKSRRATGWLFAEDQSFTLDRATSMVQTMNISSKLANTAVYDTPEGWCVETGALSNWFGIDFEPDLYNALVRLTSERELPFMQAIERRSRAARLQGRRPDFDLSKFPNAEMGYRAWRTPSVDVVAQFGARSGESSRDGFQGRVELYAAGEALGASYFARVATDDSLSPRAVRARAYRNDPDGELLGPLQATQVAIGDVETLPGRLAAQTAVGRGAFVSNRPLGQASRFSTTTLRGTLPAGWDAELYRNGQLIAFQDDRGDGRYEFLEVELFFGRNELEVVLYGPQGQIRREKNSVPVGFNQIEPGQTYYWAGVLQDNRDLIDLGTGIELGSQEWRWGVGVERGLDRRTSASLGVQNLMFAGERRTYIEGAVMRSLAGMQVELASAHQLGAGAVAEASALGRIGTVNFGLNGLVSFGDFASEFAFEETDWRAGFNFDTSLRLGRFELPVQGDFSHAELGDGSSVDEYLLTTSATAGRVAMSAQVSHLRRSQGATGPGAIDTRLRLLANARFQGFRVRGNASFLASGRDKGLETANVRIDRDINEDAEIRGQIDYTARSDEFRLAAGYAHMFDTFSLRADGFATTTGAFGAAVQLAFSLGPDPVSGGVRLSNTKLARSGQAAVTVFRDDDGDGKRGPDEVLLENVMVEAGLRSTDAVTGPDGRTIVDDLRPFRPVLVGIDESSLDDPFLAPAGKGIVVTPRPGIIAQIELPISATGEVEGSILSPSGVQKPGVRLELVDRNGVVAATAISEFDGFFLFQRVPYGRYTLQVGEDSARALKVRTNLSLREGTDVAVDRDNDVVRLGAIALEPSDAGESDRAGEPVALAPRGSPGS
ncbi:MAG: carboxypeptidase-like regulatory domain-containing protein [Erythrobacter sp.]